MISKEYWDKYKAITKEQDQLLDDYVRCKIGKTEFTNKNEKLKAEFYQLYYDLRDGKYNK